MSTPAVSTTKRDAINTEVVKNPDVDGTNHADFIKRIITDMCAYFSASCRLPRYPELVQGYSQSAASPATDITGIDSNEFLIDVNRSGLQTVSITLANCDTGANTATELQTQIRALDIDGFDEVTVTYASSLYTITSGRYGTDSRILIRSQGKDTKHVAENLKLGPLYGGVEYTGGQDEPEADECVRELVLAYYAKTGGGGSGSGGFGTTTAAFMPNQQTVVFRAEDVPQRARQILASFRRL